MVVLVNVIKPQGLEPLQFPTKFRSPSLHPLGAAGVLVLVLRPRLATTTILALVALLTANVVADLGLARLMAAGRERGDWELALAFSVVPVIGVVYALALLRTARGTAG